MKRLNRFRFFTIILALGLLALLGAGALKEAKAGESERTFSADIVTAFDEKVCEEREMRLAQLLKPIVNKNCCKVTHINPKSGLVTVKVIMTGETVNFPASETRLRSLKRGQSISANFIFDSVQSVGGPLGADGRCKCGQKKPDGSCWCTGERPCCGPLAGCPIGSCGKKQPIPNITPNK